MGMSTSGVSSYMIMLEPDPDPLARNSSQMAGEM
jgi:hypothetical protein